MYQIIGAVKSRTLRVLWMLEELGLSYEHIAASPVSQKLLVGNLIKSGATVESIGRQRISDGRSDVSA